VSQLEPPDAGQICKFMISGKDPILIATKK